MTSVELILFLFLFISHSILLIIVLYNYSTAPQINNILKAENNPELISILIPARNEAKNISNLLDSLLVQTHKNHEIIILDDNSTDSTSDIVGQHCENNTNISLISGKPLPTGWLGKNWACHQLSKIAHGKYLLFIDADVRLGDNAISAALYNMLDSRTDMLTVFPTQKLSSFSEWLIVPLMNWLLLNLLPLRFVQKYKSKKLTAANGQFVLISAKVYRALNLHESVKSEVVEDMAMAKLLKGNGKRIITMLGADAVYCRMYDSFKQAFDGFSKNFFKGFNVSKLSFSFILIILLFLFLAPIMIVFLNNLFLLIVFMIALERIFISLISKQNWIINLFLHPFQMVLMFLIGVRSIYGKNVLWKERSV